MAKWSVHSTELPMVVGSTTIDGQNLYSPFSKSNFFIYQPKGLRFLESLILSKSLSLKISMSTFLTLKAKIILRLVYIKYPRKFFEYMGSVGNDYGFCHLNYPG